MSERFFVYQNPEDSYSSLERRFISEVPYLEQTKSWRGGMRYKYSPDTFELNQKQLARMQGAGRIIGGFLNTPDFLEFRIDFIESSNGTLFITEVQTDDRGLPAIAIARNSKGFDQSGNFQGIYQPLLTAFKKCSGIENPKVLITFPKDELFYYLGFYDLARMLSAYGNIEMLVVPREDISPNEDKQVKVKMPDAYQIQFNPDLTWNFSDEPINVGKNIQPRLTKQLLLELNSDETFRRQKFVPTVKKPSQIGSDRHNWVLKPIDGRWSKGVVFGFKTTQKEWDEAISREGLIAQKFIEPRKRKFYVRQGPNKYSLEAFYTRVEGYYVKDFDTNLWELTDVLATGTASLPVHGRRDSIMIPATVKSVD